MKRGANVTKTVLRRNLLENVAVIIILAVALIFFTFPFYWLVSTSFKVYYEQFSYPPTFIPGQIFLANYRIGLLDLWGIKGITDSSIVASLNTLLVLAIATPAAYSLARFKFKRSESLATWILSQRMLPPIAVAIPLFLIWKMVGWLDTYQALVLTYAVFNLPFAVWMMKGFFEDLPKDMEESAMVDGCSTLTAFVRVALPLTAPGLVATALFCFIFSWNEFLFAVVLTRWTVKTLPVVIPGLVYGHSILWGAICAVTLVGVLPAILIALFLQKYLVRGLTLGAIRGA